MTSRIESVPDEQRADAVPAERDAAVRRRAVAERVEQEAELLLRLVLGQAHHREHPLLHVAAVDTDRPAADLVAVADDVVGVGQRRAGVGVEGVDRLRLGRGERVVHGRPRAASRPRRRRRPARPRPARTAARRRPTRTTTADSSISPSALADLEPGRAEQRARRRRRAGGEEHAVAGLRADVRGQPVALGVGQVLGDRAAQLAVLADQDVGQPAVPALLGELLPARRACAAAATRRRA